MGQTMSVRLFSSDHGVQIGKMFVFVMEAVGMGTRWKESYLLFLGHTASIWIHRSCFGIHSFTYELYISYTLFNPDPDSHLR